MLAGSSSEPLSLSKQVFCQIDIYVVYGSVAWASVVGVRRRHIVQAFDVLVVFTVVKDVCLHIGCGEA